MVQSLYVSLDQHTVVARGQEVAEGVGKGVGYERLDPRRGLGGCG